MAPLAPEIMQSIVAARTDQAVMLEKLERPPASWGGQPRRLLKAGGMYQRVRAPLTGAIVAP